MEIDDYTGEVDPFAEEPAPEVDEILTELRALERKKAYLLELLDALGYIPTDL